MIEYVGVRDLTALLASDGLHNFLLGLVEYIEADFRRWSEFDKSVRLASHSSDGVIELMPASDGQLYSFKYVNGHPNNFNLGLQTVTAFGVLSDVATGYPRFISEMTILTALRTAATSALAAKYLAREDAATMALIGLGAQSEFQATAFHALLGIRKLRVYDIDETVTDKFCRNMRGHDLEIVRVNSADAAVLGADVITTITADKKLATILSDNMVGNGVHINAVGGDCPGKTELQKQILERSKVFVEFTPQTRIEGEIQQMLPDFEVTELWEVIEGRAAGRSSPDEVTIFDSVGYGIEDFSALRYLLDRARGSEFIKTVDLITEPDNPRDLFGLLEKASPQLHLAASS